MADLIRERALIKLQDEIFASTLKVPAWQKDAANIIDIISSALTRSSTIGEKVFRSRKTNNKLYIYKPLNYVLSALLEINFLCSVKYVLDWEYSSQAQI